MIYLYWTLGVYFSGLIVAAIVGGYNDAYNGNIHRSSDVNDNILATFIWPLFVLIRALLFIGKAPIRLGKLLRVGVKKITNRPKQPQWVAPR